MADIEAEQLLRQAKARSTKGQNTNVDDQQINPTTDASTGIAMPASKPKIESGSINLPATKSYAAFISHKKAHSKHGDSSETLAIRLKVNVCVCVKLRCGLLLMWFTDCLVYRRAK